MTSLKKWSHLVLCGHLWLAERFRCVCKIHSCARRWIFNGIAGIKCTTYVSVICWKSVLKTIGNKTLYSEIVWLLQFLFVEKVGEKVTIGYATILSGHLFFYISWKKSTATYVMEFSCHVATLNLFPFYRSNEEESVLLNLQLLLWSISYKIYKELILKFLS